MSSWFDCTGSPERDKKPGLIAGAAVVLASIIVLGLLLLATAGAANLPDRAFRVPDDSDLVLHIDLSDVPDKDAKKWPGTVMRVVDGDTLIVADAEMVEHTIRVLYVDAPESRRGAKATKDAESLGIPVEELIKAGKAASAFTRMLLDGTRRQVVVETQGVDVYRRELATVEIIGMGDLSSILIGNGMAKIYRRSKYPRELVGQEDAARRAKSGFWKTIWK